VLLSDGDFKNLAADVGQVIDLAGLGVIVGGLLTASFLGARGLTQKLPGDEVFRRYRERVGKSILLGLEFLVAADIIRTVAVAPTFRGVGVLAVIVAVRTFLSFTLEVELEGRWPWQKAQRAA
jgi:uncharacterized membrane protein